MGIENRDYYRISTGTVQLNPPKYEEWLTNELMEWVREAPLESDALSNIPVIMKEYERRKTFWQRLKALFGEYR